MKSGEILRVGTDVDVPDVSISTSVQVDALLTKSLTTNEYSTSASAS